MTNSAKLSVGDAVGWRWFNGVAEGIIIEISPQKTTIHSKGKVISRNGTQENPAVIIKHNSGSQVIKLQSELLNTTE